MGVLATFVPENVDTVGEIIIFLGAIFGALTGVVVAFRTWILPGLREFMMILRKANTVFDMMLQTHPIPLPDGTTADFALPAALAHLAESQNKIFERQDEDSRWRRQHDLHWPMDRDIMVEVEGTMKLVDPHPPKATEGGSI